MGKNVKKKFIFLLFLLPSLLSATIINIPADQPTIQAGIDVAVNADTVLKAPETYTENINFSGKKILCQWLKFNSGSSSD
ncbi:MAG: hypothetical protein H8D22_09225 [Candidatus Cloacimonetes bacterium]|nr:hypothetical protein [Candidatus Cloacimonadota bacterium]